MNITGINSSLISGLNKPGQVVDNNVSFGEVINNELEKLNSKQFEADKLTQDLISGNVNDLHTVMIATEEARLSLELAVQVRNKVVEAYKEINNMQL